jgi:hypothetical protein
MSLVMVKGEQRRKKRVFRSSLQVPVCHLGKPLTHKKIPLPVNDGSVFIDIYLNALEHRTIEAPYKQPKVGPKNRRVLERKIAPYGLIATDGSIKRCTIESGDGSSEPM